MGDFTQACRSPYPIGYNNPRAVAQVAPSAQELPSFWVKCFDGEANLGGVSLDDYCSKREAGTRSYNRERDGPETDQPWLKWQCVPA